MTRTCPRGTTSISIATRPGSWNAPGRGPRQLARFRPLERLPRGPLRRMPRRRLPSGARRARGRVLYSMTGHRSLNRTRKALLEVQDGYPFRLHDDSRHLREHPADLLHPRPALLRAKVPFCRRCVFRHHAGDGFNMGRAPNLQHLVGPCIAVDAERHFSVRRERPDLRCLWWRAEDDLLAIPVKPNWDNAWGAVTPDIGEASGRG